MFFPEKIKRIRKTDRVLEIGPGGSPHPRADVLLELRFDDPREALNQRGGTEPLRTDKVTVYYDGGKFPFGDREFDYVICSHVLEHVPDVESFVAEMFRVAPMGYIEYPTIYYEYLYNFSVHVQLVNFESGELWYMPKCESSLTTFQPVQTLFHRSLELGYSDLVEDLKTVMFQGFEWHKSFPVRRASKIEELSITAYELATLPRPTRNIRRVLRWLEGRLNRLRLRRAE